MRSSVSGACRFFVALTAMSYLLLLLICFCYPISFSPGCQAGMSSRDDKLSKRKNPCPFFRADRDFYLSVCFQPTFSFRRVRLRMTARVAIIRTTAIARLIHTFCTSAAIKYETRHTPATVMA